MLTRRYSFQKGRESRPQLPQLLQSRPKSRIHQHRRVHVPLHRQPANRRRVQIDQEAARRIPGLHRRTQDHRAAPLAGCRADFRGMQRLAVEQVEQPGPGEELGGSPERLGLEMGHLWKRVSR